MFRAVCFNNSSSEVHCKWSWHFFAVANGFFLSAEISDVWWGVTLTIAPSLPYYYLWPTEKWNLWVFYCTCRNLSDSVDINFMLLCKQFTKVSCLVDSMSLCSYCQGTDRVCTEMCGVEVKPSKRVLHALFWYRELFRMPFYFEGQAC